MITVASVWLNLKNVFAVATVDAFGAERRVKLGAIVLELNFERVEVNMVSCSLE